MFRKSMITGEKETSFDDNFYTNGNEEEKIEKVEIKKVKFKKFKLRKISFEGDLKIFLILFIIGLVSIIACGIKLNIIGIISNIVTLLIAFAIYNYSVAIKKLTEEENRVLWNMFLTVKNFFEYINEGLLYYGDRLVLIGSIFIFLSVFWVFSGLAPIGIILIAIGNVIIFAEGDFEDIEKSNRKSSVLLLIGIGIDFILSGFGPITPMLFISCSILNFINVSFKTFEYKNPL